VILSPDDAVYGYVLVALRGGQRERQSSGGDRASVGKRRRRLFDDYMDTQVTIWEKEIDI
jgi:hypothetical protein